VGLVAGGDDDGEAEGGGVGSIAPAHRARSGRDERGTRSFVDGEAEYRAEFYFRLRAGRVRGFAHSFVL
jgi:hypothetical protein